MKIRFYQVSITADLDLVSPQAAYDFLVSLNQIGLDVSAEYYSLEEDGFRRTYSLDEIKNQMKKNSIVSSEDVSLSKSPLCSNCGFQHSGGTCYDV
jgi:hypothetical protein